MLVISMALCQRPDVLLLDEPSLGLGQTVITTVAGILRSHSARGGSILLVEQKPLVAAAAADRLLFLEKGRIQKEGSPADLLEDPGFIARYLGVPAGRV